MKIIFFLYYLLLIFLTIFSYGFVDANFPIIPSRFLFNFVNLQRLLATVIYVFIVVSLFGFYFYFLKQIDRKKIESRQVKRLIFLTVLILFFSFPAFSYDLFNYLATAKVSFFYRENPYLVMPIEFIGEPMLKFTHAANKIALYGPVWILLTFIPFWLGFGNLFLTIFSFKGFVVLFYLFLLFLIWKISRGNLKSLAIFAFNPLVLIETLVSSHNDVVMMSLALFSFLLLFKKKKIMTLLTFLASVGIKYATIALLPIFFWSKKESQERFFTLAYWLMFLAFLAAPLREEIYPWYVIWFLTFSCLIPQNRLVFWLTLGLSFGTLFRYSPFLLTGSWGGITPMIKKIVTIFPLLVGLIAFFLERICLKKDLFFPSLKFPSVYLKYLRRDK